MTTRTQPQREAALDPTLGGLANLIARIEALNKAAQTLSQRHGPRSRQVRTARRLVRMLQEASRLLAVELLRQDAPAEEVMLMAGVTWRVLESWCEDADDPPLPAWHRVALRAEEERAARLTAKNRREFKKDLRYRHKLEELRELKNEYRMTEGMACQPFTQNSSDEIDALQGQLDAWFVVEPQLWDEDEFFAAHRGEPELRIGQPGGAGPRRDEWAEEDKFGAEDFDLDDEELF